MGLRDWLFRRPAAAAPAAAPKIARRPASEAMRTVSGRAKRKDRQSPFILPAFPPSAMPRPSATMAMDDAIGSVMGWGAAAALSGLSEGLGFLGYTYLAEIAQRPEYRRISETIATEMVRKWIKIQSAGDDDKTKQIDALNKAFERLCVKDAFRQAAEQDGFFGRSHMFIDLGTTNDSAELKTPIGNGQDDASKAKVGNGDFKSLRTVEPVWTYPMGYNSTDPLSETWYRPQFWMVMNREIHASRLLTFVGREVPDILKPAYAFGGLSLSQMAKPYVDNWIRTRESVGNLIASFSVSGVKINLDEALQANEGGAPAGEGLFSRIEMFNRLRDNMGTMALNLEEEFFNVSTPLGTLDALQAQSQEHICSVSGIPLVKYTGITPKGLNASSDGEIRAFYDWIHSYQEALFRPNLTIVFNLIQLSEFGKIDPDLTFIFEPLWSMDEKEQAEVRKTEAETDGILIEEGVILPEESRARVAADPDSPYASLDLSLEIEPPAPSESAPVPEPTLQARSEE